MKMTKPLKILEKFASENNLQTEATTEQLRDYPSSFKPNYTVKVLKGNSVLFIISFNTKQYYVDEVIDEGQNCLTQLEKLLKSAGIVRVK